MPPPTRGFGRFLRAGVEVWRQDRRFRLLSSPVAGHRQIPPCSGLIGPECNADWDAPVNPSSLPGTWTKLWAFERRDRDAPIGRLSTWQAIHGSEITSRESKGSSVDGDVQDFHPVAFEARPLGATSYS